MNENLVRVGCAQDGQPIMVDAREAERIRKEWVAEHAQRCSCGGDVVTQPDGAVTKFGWPRRRNDPWSVLQRRDEVRRLDSRLTDPNGHWKLDLDHKTHSTRRDADGKLAI